MSTARFEISEVIKESPVISIWLTLSLALFFIGPFLKYSFYQPWLTFFGNKELEQRHFLWIPQAFFFSAFFSLAWLLFFGHRNRKSPV